MRRALRAVVLGGALHFKQESRNPFFLWIVICTPLVYATMAYFLFRGGQDDATLVTASLGSALMGIWSLTTTAAASTLGRQRRVGILELLVAAPTPFWLTIVPITLALAALGVYSLATGLIYVTVLFGVPVTIANPFAFCVSVLPMILSMGMLGFLFCAAFVRFRSSWMVGNLFEFPVWTLSGMLIPIAVLPVWVEPISWFVAPTWGMSALREAALGNASPWDDIGMCIALSVVYAAAGGALLRVFLRSALRRGTLALS
ncbi:MAG: ABC transporter permease [Thermoleophilia bacterium]|nr:ABC transporter permease [Thermoleophilia bacterium]